MKVFLGGSRTIAWLPEQVQKEVTSIAATGAGFLVGDAAGADLAFQRLLLERMLDRVEVYCVEGGPRNCVGNWTVNNIASSKRAGTYEHYAAKDAAMADNADSGLIVWDGKSKGSLLQAMRLVAVNKPVSMYVTPTDSMCRLESHEDCTSTMQILPANARRIVAKRMRTEGIWETPSLFESRT